MPLISLEVSFLAVTNADLAGPAASISPEARPRTPSLTSLGERTPFIELAVLATPARRAIYAFSDVEDFTALEARLGGLYGEAEGSLAPLRQRRSGRAAVLHLFRLAAGFESRARAEAAMLRSNFEREAGEEGARPVLGALFRRALRIAEAAEGEAAEAEARVGPMEVSPSPFSTAEAPGGLARSRSTRSKAGDCRPGSACLDPEDLELQALRRKIAAPLAPPSLEALLESETEAFMRYLEWGDVPALRLALGLRAETLRREAAAKVLRSLSHLSTEDRAVVEELSHKVIDEFLGGALQRLGEGEAKAGAHAALLRDIFDLPREDRA
ncbi:MAG TPA: hypothetical protein VMV83_14940 [Rectinemataceae bacterium]|nr:hypothetical protein [Rectinemataceae bacterium]